MSSGATSAYADVPRSGTGPPVLVLHSWWGLTPGIKERCNRLADAGYAAVAPDLFGGEVARDADHGRALLAAASPDELAMGVTSCARALRDMPASTDEPISIVGFSMGASLGLWLSEREAGAVGQVVGFYGTQSIDFVGTTADYQFHLVEGDPMVDGDELALMEASLGLAGRGVEVFTYDGVGHGFAESGTPAYDEAAAESAWARTIAFLDRRG